MASDKRTTVGFQYPTDGKINYKVSPSASSSTRPTTKVADDKSKLIPEKFPQISQTQMHIDIGERPVELMDWQPYVAEGFKDKFIRKTKENPLVPGGLLLTVTALTCGLYMFWTGQSRRSNFFMKMRVSAQGFTIAAFLAGCFYQRYKKGDTNSYTAAQPSKAE